MGITITDVKIVSLCSKHRKSEEDAIKDKNGNIIPDKDICCFVCELYT